VGWIGPLESRPGRLVLVAPDEEEENNALDAAQQEFDRHDGPGSGREGGGEELERCQVRLCR